jgi:hypothetical protein
MVAPWCWWDGEPWHGEIPEAEFRAIVAAYVARYGAYMPDLPEREPSLLEAWRAKRTTADVWGGQRPTRGAAS